MHAELIDNKHHVITWDDARPLPTEYPSSRNPVIIPKNIFKQLKKNYLEMFFILAEWTE